MRSDSIATCQHCFFHLLIFTIPRWNKRDFIEDPKYRYFTKKAARYGFYIDVNYPWRIIADITSVEMQRYMRYYGVNENENTSSDFFEKYYYKSCHDDIGLLRDLLISTASENKFCKLNQDSPQFSDRKWLIGFYIDLLLKYSRNTLTYTKRSHIVHYANMAEDLETASEIVWWRLRKNGVEL